MSRLPDSRPDNTRTAKIGDFWAVLRVGLAMTLLSMRRSPVYRVLGILWSVLLVLSVIFYLSIGLPELVWFPVGLIAAAILLVLMILIIHIAWRLIDPNRLVLLAPGDDAILDVIFLSRRRLSIANHGRAFKATTAAGLRRSTADWVAGLTDYEVDIRAQNKRVAKHYIEQFPMLKIVGKDWMQHPRLGLRSNASDAIDGFKAAHINDVA